MRKSQSINNVTQTSPNWQKNATGQNTTGTKTWKPWNFMEGMEEGRKEGRKEGTWSLGQIRPKLNLKSAAKIGA